MMNDSVECIYGWAGPGGVTWPDYEKARSYNVSAWEVEPGAVTTAAAVFYGYVPFLVVCWLSISLVLRRGTRELSLVVWSIVNWFGVEVVLKNLIQGSRPWQSCISSYGMPCTEAAFIFGMFLVQFSDFLSRSRMIADVPGSFSAAPWVLHDQAAAPPKLCRNLLESCVTATQSSWDEVSYSHQVMHLTGWIFLLLPVPLGRMLVHDASASQVFVGMCLGLLLALAWLSLTGWLQHSYNHRLGKILIKAGKAALLSHNMALPCHVAEVRCTCETDDAGQRVWESPEPEQELAWYLEQTKRRLFKLGKSGRLLPHERLYLELREQRLETLLRGTRADLAAVGRGHHTRSEFSEMEMRGWTPKDFRAHLTPVAARVSRHHGNSQEALVLSGNALSS